MVDKKIKYKRQLMKTDKKQLTFTANGEVAKKKDNEGTRVALELLSPLYCCPFCLYAGKVHTFEMKTPKGNTSKRYKCPECNAIMVKRTLEKKMDAEEYAEWVFDYRLSGFWQKCNFKVWKERLYKLGMSHKFWEKYRLLKGEVAEQETYEEHFNKEQEEWAKEQEAI